MFLLKDNYTLRLKTELPDDQVDQLAGKFLDESHFDYLITGKATVLKPNGDVLVKYLPDVLNPNWAATAYTTLRKAAAKSFNRGLASGAEKLTRRKDGTRPTTGQTKDGVESGIIGSFDRYTRIPLCRKTAFNINHPDLFAAALPFIREVNTIFEREMPAQFAAQMDMIKRTHPDWHISNTAFTTITVNKNFRTAVHKDAGDLRAGFGVMAALRGGAFSGGYLVFPKFRVAVDMRSCGVCLADVHEWHGNTEMIGLQAAWERISCVFYYRENMFRCASAAEEIEIAKRRKPGTPLYPEVANDGQ